MASRTKEPDLDAALLLARLALLARDPAARRGVHVEYDGQDVILRFAGAVPDVPKLPALFQNELDRLIEKRKDQSITPEEDRALDAALDYLDHLTLLELERLGTTAG
jgi:hypothetical protein